MAFTLVLWVTAPEVRRIVDWQSSYHDFSVVNVAPAFVSLLGFPWILFSRRRVHRDIGIFFGVVLVVMSYAVVVGAIRNGLVSALADGPLIVAPFVFGLFVLTAPDDDARVRGIVQQWATWGALLLGAYSIYQFLVLPAWDEAWLIDSGVGNLGDPVAKEFRVFGTLGTASYLAQVLAAMLLVLVAERRTLLQLVAAGAGLAGLALTLSRGGWLSLVAGLLVLVILGRIRILRFVAVGVLVFVVLSATGSPIVERVQERVTETRSEGLNDTSLTARYGFQLRVAPEALADFDGSGMGSTGRAVLVGGNPQLSNPRFVSFDTGIFESLVRYGSLAGTVILGGLALLVVRTAARSRRGTLFDACTAAGFAAIAFGMLFQDTQRGVFGVVLWTLLAVQGRGGRVDRRQQLAETAT